VQYSLLAPGKHPAVASWLYQDKGISRVGTLCSRPRPGRPTWHFHAPGLRHPFPFRGPLKLSWRLANATFAWSIPQWWGEGAVARSSLPETDSSSRRCCCSQAGSRRSTRTHAEKALCLPRPRHPWLRRLGPGPRRGERTSAGLASHDRGERTPSGWDESWSMTDDR
jgi:hypothetical protein